MGNIVISRRSLVVGLAALLAVGGSVTAAMRYDSRSDEGAVAMERPVEPPTRLSPPVGSIAIPVAGVTREELRDSFGASRGSSRVHEAIDIGGVLGAPVVAAVDGSILKLYESGAGGRTIYLAGQADRRVYYYAHLDAYAEGLTEGERVRQGEIIGYVGTTGNASKGFPHLHFAIEEMAATGEWWKGKPMNPYPILKSRGFTVDREHIFSQAGSEPRLPGQK